MDQKNSRIRRSESLTNRTSSKVKFGKGKGSFPMPSFLSPSPLLKEPQTIGVFVKSDCGYLHYKKERRKKLQVTFS